MYILNILFIRTDMAYYANYRDITYYHNITMLNIVISIKGYE